MPPGGRGEIENGTWYDFDIYNFSSAARCQSWNVSTLFYIYAPFVKKVRLRFLISGVLAKICNKTKKRCHFWASYLARILKFIYGFDRFRDGNYTLFLIVLIICWNLFERPWWCPYKMCFSSSRHPHPVQKKHWNSLTRKLKCHLWFLAGMPTTKKGLTSGFAFGISNNSWRLLFPDQNFLNFSKIHMGRHIFS